MNSNFLDPEYPSDSFADELNLSASPSLNEFAWGHGMDQQPDELNLFPDLSSFEQDDNQRTNSGLDKFSEQYSHQVLTPQSSNVSTPDHTTSASHFAQDHTYPMMNGVAISTTSHVQSTHRPALAVNSRLTPAHSGPSSNASPADGVNPAASPSIFVSSYNRGDSPARHPTQRARASSKRSRGDRSSMHLNPEIPNDGSDEEKERPSTTLSQEQGRRPSVMPDEREGYTGLDPTVRPDIYVPSLQDLDEARAREEKKLTVEDWLDKSESGSNADPLEIGSSKSKVSKRPRAVSDGGKAMGLGIVNTRNIPGPGALLDEESGEEEEVSSDAVESADSESPFTGPIPQISDQDIGYFPPVTINYPQSDAQNAQVAEQEDPLPRQFFSPSWHNPFGDRNVDGSNPPPSTSREAMHRYELETAKFETASRAATWGTRRRISESDIRSLLGDENSLRRLSITPGPAVIENRSRKNSNIGQSIIDSARGIMRKASINKAKTPPPPPRDELEHSLTGNKRASGSSIKPIQRISSFGRQQKSPPLNTSSAFMAMTGQMAAIGGSNSASTAVVSPPEKTGKSIKRQRSRSEIPKSSKPQGLVAQWTNYGGPPMPKLASPMQERSFQDFPRLKREPSQDEIGEDNDDEDDLADESGIKMDLHIRTAIIVPDHAGFKTHGRELNPRVHDFLLDRIANEQVRRYRKLVEHKVKHIQAVQRNRKCASGVRCNALGEGPKVLEPRRGSKDPTIVTQFAVPGEDSEDEALDENGDAVTAASFPEGIPLPPAKRLPAEFECTLCFKVKTFKKPSDWTKHVHEDVQPFTCTFPRCAEPKSFKRKADWVRHENERHRQLEWWQCNVPECNHICYRKDNFVQHLVREHKKPEPKTKPRGSMNKPENIAARETEEVWRLVETCHFETDKKPRDEPCRFCGNICSSWKRLTVHLARHMEQVSLPVLRLVDQRVVGPDTIVSPLPPQIKTEFSTSQLSVSPVPIQSFETGRPTSTLFPVASAPAQQASPNSSYVMGNANMHHASASPIPEQMFFTPQPRMQQQPNFMMQNQYPTSAPLQPVHSGHLDTINTPVDTSPFPEQAAYNAIPYNMNQGYSPAAHTPVNNPSASTYPPPSNAVPRHFQRPSSATPSHHSNISNPDFGLENMTLSTGFGSITTSMAEQTMFQSPVDTIDNQFANYESSSSNPLGGQNGLGMDLGLGGYTNLSMQPQYMGDGGHDLNQGIQAAYMQGHVHSGRGSPHGSQHGGQGSYGF